MQVIPVIDVKGGVVVHAVGGQRDRYRPIETPLAERSEPLAVVEGLLNVFAFGRLYIADLDGIAGRRRDIGLIRELRSAWPGLEIWVDNGGSERRDIAELASMDRVRPVVGSETMNSDSDLDALWGVAGGDAILSLDFKGDRYIGPDHLLHDPARWPKTVIAMTLAAVGAAAGPDLRRVRQLKALRPDAAIVAAGGVRNRCDLDDLAAAGASAALVATALHSGTLKAGDLG